MFWLYKHILVELSKYVYVNAYWVVLDENYLHQHFYGLVRQNMSPQTKQNR